MCTQTDHVIDIAARYTVCIIPLNILVTLIHADTVALVTQPLCNNTKKSDLVKSLSRTTITPPSTLIRLFHNQSPRPTNLLPIKPDIPPLTLHNDLPSKPLTCPPKPPLPNRLRKHPLLHQLEEIPLARTTLSLEIPKHPAQRVRLERIKLRLDVSAHAVPPGGRPVPDAPGQAGARADEVGAGEGAFAAVPGAEAVEVFRAVGQRGGPFAHDGPFVGGVVGGGLIAVSGVLDRLGHDVRKGAYSVARHA